MIFDDFVEKWSLTSIASKFRLQEVVVRKVRSYFKKLTKIISKPPQPCMANKTQRQRHINWIQNLLTKLSGVHYTVEDIRQKFNQEFSDSPKLSKDTI